MIKEIVAYLTGIALIVFPEPATTMTGMIILAGSLGYSAVTGGEKQE